MLFNKNHNVKEDPRNKVGKRSVANRNVEMVVPGLILAKINGAEIGGEGGTNNKLVVNVGSKGVKTGGESFHASVNVTGPMTQ
jgi:hypothetical protein